jgi:hypothetical protein
MLQPNQALDASVLLSARWPQIRVNALPFWSPDAAAASRWALHAAGSPQHSSELACLSSVGICPAHSLAAGGSGAPWDGPNGFAKVVEVQAR